VSKAVDRAYITECQYATDANLAARQSIYRFQTPRVALWHSTFDLADLRGDERVLDVGCGNGYYLGALRDASHGGLVVGADLSEGMLRSAAARSGRATLMLGDAQRLPFPGDSFDVALAMHMLYHVPDRAIAISELRRVVRPGGVVLVVTNSTEHLLELDELLAESMRQVFGTESMMLSRTTLPFKMEDGGMELRTLFASVERHDFPSELVITEVDPVLAYLRSTAAFVAKDPRLDPVLDEVSARIRERIERDGAFRVRTGAGCFVCR
jgi:ubiquinone/menaquinone biosynthesis C-methylase UbiE